MIRKHSRRSAITSESLGKASLAVLSLTLSLGLAGCKEKESATSREAKNESPAVRQTTAESSESNPLSASRTPSEPDSRTPLTRPTAADQSAAGISDQKSVSAEPDTGSPAESPESVNSGSAGKRSPQEALTAAKKSHQSATNYARQGKLEPAYKAAVEGWQMVRIHPSDPNCKQMAAELIEDIKKYSDQLVKAAGGKAGMADDSKPIRFE